MDDSYEEYDPGYDEGTDFDDYTPPVEVAAASSTVSSDYALATLRRVLASQDGTTPESALEHFTHVASSSGPVLDVIGSPTSRTYEGVFECLRAECANRSGGHLVLAQLELARLYDDDVRGELAAISNSVVGLDEAVVADPLAVWGALNEAVQRMRASASAGAYISHLRAQRPVEDLMDVFRKVEPPTKRQAVIRHGGLPTARAVLQAKESARAGRPNVRLSSGFRTLDLAFTGTGDAVGFVGLGEGAVIAAPTGSGKSSFSYTLVPAMLLDIHNWGFPDGRLLFFHTEEESEDKLRAMEFSSGQKYHHLADNLIVEAVGTSRQRIVELIYDVVIDARRRSSETGRAITDFLPYAVVLDYLQSISERGEDEKTATATTAELILRGIQAWNPEEMAKFSGVDFRTYAGFAWPSGMEHHRVATVSFAQLVKQNEGSLFYKAGSRDNSLSEFTLEDSRSTPGWVDASGSPWCWKVEEGDARILRQNAVRGSGIILQNATSIVFLHRSRPRNNPAVGPAGSKHLEDRRARLILDKTRTGSAMTYVPMDFDVDREERRARFYDTLAEEALSQGRFTVDGSYSEPGDPMLPVRVKASPLAGIHY